MSSGIRAEEPRSSMHRRRTAPGPLQRCLSRYDCDSDYDRYHTSMSHGKKMIALRFRASDEGNSSSSLLWDAAYRKSCDFCIEKKLKCAGRGTICKKCISKGICCTYSLKHRSVVRARDMGMLTTDAILDAEEALNSNVKILSSSEVGSRKCILPPIRDLLERSSSMPYAGSSSSVYPKHDYLMMASPSWLATGEHSKADGEHFSASGGVTLRHLYSFESCATTDEANSSVCGSEADNMDFVEPTKAADIPMTPSALLTDSYKQSVDMHRGADDTKMSTSERLSHMLRLLSEYQQAGRVDDVLRQLQELRSAGFISERFCNSQLEKVLQTSQRECS